MKVILSESQVNRSVEIFNKLMNANKYEHVCRIMVDYDDEFDKYVLNIFFSRDFAVNNKNFTRFKNITTNEIGERFLNWAGLNPILYMHFEKCS